jgi:hypothetical protein
MQETAARQVWVIRDETDGYIGTGLKRAWRYVWGLVFVIVMTMLSEYGPHTVYSKVMSTAPAASQQMVRTIK